MSAVTALRTSGAIDDGPAAEISQNLSPTDILGLDASQTLDKVKNVVRRAVPANPKSTAAESAKSNAASLAIVSAAEDAAKKTFEPPPDVACSISLLTFREASDIFGIRVAKDYVAVQVIVRNLNSKDEFLLHDVQLAVDTDPCGGFAQFDGGRDRLLVRAVALRNQQTDPRNWAVRILEGVGTVASSAVGFGSYDFSLGLGVYNSITPAVKSIFPDYTIDQLNRISDLTFTSSGQTRTVVGKDGVVMFVTFFPSKPLEQAWWIRDAGSISGATNPVMAAASLECAKQTVAAKAHFDGTSNSKTSNNGKETEERVFDPKPNPYRHWKPDALLEFRRHTFVTVAGVHITPETDLLANLDSLSCPEANGFLDLSSNTAAKAKPATSSSISPHGGPAARKTGTTSKQGAGKAGAAHRSHMAKKISREETDTAASDSDIKGTEKDSNPNAVTPSLKTDQSPQAASFVCDAKGKNLDKIALVRLRNAKEALDTDIAEGSMDIKSGDSTEGKVTFKKPDVLALTGDTYNVVLVGSNKVEIPTNIVKRLTPFISSIDPQTVSLKGRNEIQLKLFGSSLDLAKQAVLVSADDVTTPMTISNSKTTSVTLTYAKQGTFPLKPGTYSLRLILSDDTSSPWLKNNVVALQ